MRGLKQKLHEKGQTHKQTDGHRESMKESAKGRFFENEYVKFLLYLAVGSLPNSVPVSRPQEGVLASETLLKETLCIRNRSLASPHSGKIQTESQGT